MAKRSTIAKKAATSTKGRRRAAASIKRVPKKPTLLSLDLETVQLISADFNKSFLNESPKTEEVQLTYRCDLNYLTEEDNVIFGLCSCSAKKEEKGQSIIEVSATYFFRAGSTQKADKDEFKLIGRHVARNMIWPLFRAHFSSINSQAVLEMPELPLSPSVEVEPFPRESKKPAELV